MKKIKIINGLVYRFKMILQYFRYLMNFVIPFNNYAIIEPFGRIGNNLQQIALGSMFSNSKKLNFFYSEDELLEEFSLINNSFHEKFKFFKKKYNFYFYESKNDVFKIFPLQDISEDFIYQNIELTFKEILKPNLKFLKKLDISDDVLVIHIRSGDIFEKNKYPGYVQNPVSYYLPLIQKYKECLIVTEQKRNNPVIPYLLKYDNVKIQSLDKFTDFNTIYSAKNLATSGVGTFPIAAALLSTNLKNFYYSNYFLTEHLNPKMLRNKKVNHFKLEILNYIPHNKWENSENNLKKMVSADVEVVLPDNFN